MLPGDRADAVETAGRRWATVGIFGQLQFGRGLLDPTSTCLSASVMELSLPYMCILLSSHYDMIAATVVDLHSCVS